MNTRRTAPFLAALLLVTVTGCGVGTPEPDVDLDAVLAVTERSLLRVDSISAEDSFSGEIDDARTNELLVELADVLERDYNDQVPALYDGLISVAPREDASFVAVADADGDLEADPNEVPLWLIEIDGENARIVATGRDGAVQQSGFSGTSLLAGYLLGSMLARQRSMGVDTRALANKQPVTSQQARQARQAARSRAGSGSFARGK